MRGLLRLAAAAAALPAVFLAILAAGGAPPTAAAAVLTAALLPVALGLPRARPLALAAAACAVVLGTLTLLPRLGIAGTLAVAAALAAGALAAPSPRARGGKAPARGGDAAAAAAAAFAALGSWRTLDFLLGHTLYAAAALAVGAAAGSAAGRAGREPWTRLAGRRSAPVDRPGSAAVVAGLAGLLALNWLRFWGLNASEGERVRVPVLGGADALWLCAQAALAAALVSAALAFFEEDAPAEPGPRAGAVRACALLAPAAAAALLPLLGGDGVAVLGFAALAALGCARGFGWWRRHPIFSRVVPAALILAAVLALDARDTLREVVVNRLDNVYPGGRLAFWKEDAGETLGVYRFSTGLRVLLRDGVKDGIEAKAAVSEVLAPMLAHDTKSALFVGVFHPEALEVASLLGASATFYDTHRRCAGAAEAMGLPAVSTAAFVCGAAAPAGPYDTVIVETAPPITEPRRALELTAARVAYWAARLKPGGLLAWRVPAPAGSEAAQRLAAALRDKVGEVALVEAEAGTMLLASAAIDYDIGRMFSRYHGPMSGAYFGLALEISNGVPWRRMEPKAEAESPWRPLTALPWRL